MEGKGSEILDLVDGCLSVKALRAGAPKGDISLMVLLFHH